MFQRYLTIIKVLLLFIYGFLTRIDSSNSNEFLSMIVLPSLRNIYKEANNSNKKHQNMQIKLFLWSQREATIWVRLKKLYHFIITGSALTFVFFFEDIIILFQTCCFFLCMLWWINLLLNATFLFYAPSKPFKILFYEYEWNPGIRGN